MCHISGKFGIFSLGPRVDEGGLKQVKKIIEDWIAYHDRDNQLAFKT